MRLRLLYAEIGGFSWHFLRVLRPTKFLIETQTSRKSQPKQLKYYSIGDCELLP
jgi:hypothetical protein